MQFRHAEHREETERIDEIAPDVRIDIVFSEGFLEKNEIVSTKQKN